MVFILGFENARSFDEMLGSSRDQTKGKFWIKNR